MRSYVAQTGLEFAVLSLPGAGIAGVATTLGTGPCFSYLMDCIYLRDSGLGVGVFLSYGLSDDNNHGDLFLRNCL
jgi:hypothetical protein